MSKINKKTIIKQLLFSTTNENIDKVFDENDIKDYGKRISLLRECMKATEISYYPSKRETSLKDEYDYEKAIFVEGSWRFA